MPFFGMFKSSQDRELEAKLQFRQAKHRIQRFTQQLRRKSEEYFGLARQAYQLGDNEQFRQLAAGYLQVRETINRWERYLVKLSALEMRRNEVEATSDFLESMNSLTGSILRGASLEEINRMQMDLGRAIEKSEAQEEVLSMVMDATATQLDGADALDDRVLQQLTSGLETAVPATRARSSGTSSESNDLDKRIERAIQELDNAGES